MRSLCKHTNSSFDENMAEYLSSDSSAEEEVLSNVERLDGGIQPYRFEPSGQNRQESSDDEDEQHGDLAGDDPFTRAIDFGGRVGRPVHEWCTCSRCVAMDNPLMNICCHELEELENKLVTDDLDCICLHREFGTVVLEEAVLRTALVAMKDVKRTS